METQIHSDRHKQIYMYIVHTSTYTHVDRWRHRYTATDTNKYTCTLYTLSHTHMLIDGDTDTQRQTDRQTDRQTVTDRQTDRHKQIYMYIVHTFTYTHIDQ